MGKKDKKAKSAEQKARTLAKQSKKVAKGEKKTNAKLAVQEADSDVDDDVDLDAVLAAYAEEQAKFLKVTEETSSPPSPRSSCTLLASPSNRNELFLFGGEYYDGSTVHFYNDLFVYNISKGEWSRVTSPNSPPPRSGHAWCRAGNSTGIYASFGEFSSPKQGIFYHFNSFYHLDTNSREWTLIEPRGKAKAPPARSGHRMTYWKNYIILFGGFQDTSQQTKYLNDTWLYDCKENIWHEMKLSPGSQKPDPRSSFSFLPHESGAVLCGGYSRVKTMSSGLKQGKGSQRNILKPIIHQDTWFLRLTLPVAEATAGSPPIMRWERRKRPANNPNPARAGTTMVYHKGRGVLFGGVHDVEESEEGIESEFFNEMFIWNIDRNRFFPLTLRRPKIGNKKTVQVPRTRDRGKADEEELLRNLAALETNGSISEVADIQMKIDDKQDDNLAAKKEVPVKFEMPPARFNAQLTVQDDVVYIYGGTFEKKDVEITFSDLYSIDLGKLDGIRELYYTEPTNWNATIEESDDDEEYEMEDSEFDSEEEMEDADTMSVDAPPSTAPTELLEIPTADFEPEVSAQQDDRPFPRPFESLRDFYARTSEAWQKIVTESAIVPTEQSIKEHRKKAFENAEERWWDCREEIRNLEDEQEAAGISEIVNIQDRGGEGSGTGARRR